jgi:hypothetical protein
VADGDSVAVPFLPASECKGEELNEKNVEVMDRAMNDL